MTRGLPYPVVAFAVLAAAASALPLPQGSWIATPALVLPSALALAGAALLIVRRRASWAMAGVAVASTIVGAVAPLETIRLFGEGVGIAAPGAWLLVIGLGFLSWHSMAMLSELAGRSDAGPARWLALTVPAAFGLWVLYLWQILVVGFGIPSVLLPAPSAIGQVLAGSQELLLADFHQTFVKSVLPGFAIGCASGFVVAVLVDRVPFLQRGLQPVGSLVSALPIVGIAPIMVMWFGFDWQSKAAVVVVMTFFPMLVNTIAGLAATDAMERDLMRSYGAGYATTFLKVRLPNALPFVFNALKINSTLALIGAIVAEFFGTPIVGMGFRISTDVGRMNIDTVWATIAVAAVAGSAFYGVLALLERSVTFWHASYRQRR
ncbi:MAG: ABC transporter permease [Defluviicoccus sp.]|nr:ABC transporter permease [Defluviicoccus sp.]MDE0383963.1 ABC transporter permease [Defluviicoccus sp.]